MDVKFLDVSVLKKPNPNRFSVFCTPVESSDGYFCYWRVLWGSRGLVVEAVHCPPVFISCWDLHGSFDDSRKRIWPETNPLLHTKSNLRDCHKHVLKQWSVRHWKVLSTKCYAEWAEYGTFHGCMLWFLHCTMFQTKVHWWLLFILLPMIFVCCCSVCVNRIT